MLSMNHLKILTLVGLAAIQWICYIKIWINWCVYYNCIPTNPRIANIYLELCLLTCILAYLIMRSLQYYECIPRHSVPICCISKAIDLISNNKLCSYKYRIFINKNITSLNLNTSAVPKDCKKKNKKKNYFWRRVKMLFQFQWQETGLREI